MRDTIVKYLIEAGKIISSRIYTKKIINSKSTDVDLVTEVDRQIELFLKENLSRLLPGSEFLSEETDSELKVAEKLWVMDPIDGTLNFVHGFPMVCISLALHENGIPTHAYVYNPVINYLFEAQRGQGAKLNGIAMHVSNHTKLKECLFSTGFPYDYPTNKENNLNYFDHFNRRIQGVRRPGSAALDMAFTAAGTFDGFWEWHLKPWDVAAGILLIEEAGGIVTNFDGEPYKFTDQHIVAGNPAIHAIMLEEIKKIHNK
ncbi:MAG: inositol monophosphatase family protein [Candidatus Marinimicrobia bacterium]|nr:inositol monophosphatase family protein [Candidatus Neomarinimicrobiota bacterium]